jgi:hypothetical protein
LSTPEGRVKNEVKKQLKALGAYQHWPVLNGMGAPSLDCICCVQGYYVGIETKAPGKHPTPRQQLTIEQIRAAGGIALVIDSVELARRLPLWFGHLNNGKNIANGGGRNNPMVPTENIN